ncbi:MAG: PAS domain-containing protein [Acidobacteria bacterium]|nr:PAS domain-containing protein [Acidobacteriota bacterium]
MSHVAGRVPPIFVAVELDDYLDVSQTMLLTLSNRGRVSHINRAGCELLGRDEAGILGTSWFDTFVPASVRTGMRTLFRRTMAGNEEAGHFESPVLSRSRGERLVAWHAAPIRLADGMVAGMILSGLDITDREHSRKSRERLLKELGDVKFALDQSAIVATTDLGGAITAVNDRFCEISKYSREELLGKDHRIVNSGYHGADFFRDLWSTIAAGRIWRGEIRNRAKDGAIYWVDTTIVPFLDAQGRPYQYMAIRYEVTERKAAEARLRQRETLARLGQMSAMVAHEVKNPLAGISGALQVVGSRLPAESRDRKILDDIEDRITALNRMLQDLLTFASPREPVPAPIALGAVIGAAAAAIRSDPAMAGIRVEIHGEDVAAPLDREQMHIVFLNVLLNAAQAMGLRGDIAVRIGTGPGECEVTVADRGPGIAPALREKVFQPFFSSKSRGAGLGLPTARRIVEAHGGSLTARSRDGGGAVLTVTLPLRAAVDLEA